MHPGRLTHYHEGLEVTNGTRYIMISFVDPWKCFYKLYLNNEEMFFTLNVFILQFKFVLFFFYITKTYLFSH